MPYSCLLLMICCSFAEWIVSVVSDMPLIAYLQAASGWAHIGYRSCRLFGKSRISYGVECCGYS